MTRRNSELAPATGRGCSRCTAEGFRIEAHPWQKISDGSQRALCCTTPQLELENGERAGSTRLTRRFVTKTQSGIVTTPAANPIWSLTAGSSMIAGSLSAVRVSPAARGVVRTTWLGGSGAPL